MSVICYKNEYLSKISSLKRGAFVILFMLLFSITFLVNTGFSEGIDGYKELKFGMTAKEASATKVVKEGVVLFGQKRSVEFRTDKGQKVSKILVIFGDYDEDIRNKLIGLLSKKYKLVAEPDDLDFAAFNKEGMTPQEEMTLGFAAFNPVFENLMIRKVNWDFENGQLSFVIG